MLRVFALILAAAPAALVPAGSVHSAAPRDPVRADLAPCPGINPNIRRPPGSNCLGIVPQQCGADRVRRYVGKPFDSSLVEIRRVVGDKSIRASGQGEPVTDDLRPSRLNIVFDRARRIVKLDCY